MKILFIGGNHPRHLYYINKVARDYPLAGAVIQKREHMIPEPPQNTPKKYKDLWHRHFEGRDAAEYKYFGDQFYPDVDNLIEVTGDNLESNQVVQFVNSLRPDIVLIFGCGMIRGELARVLPEMTINLHLGLSPRYRGAATLFWPFYFLEPQWAGCTFHKIVHEPDAGDILHQCRPVLKKGDGIHDVACKAVIHAAGEIRRLLYAYPDWKFKKQTATGKNFLASDFKAHHLSAIYEVFDNDIVDHYLDEKIEGREPKLWKSV